MTGSEIYKDFLNRVDKSYSSYVDPVKLKRIFDRALNSLSEKKWMGLATQKEYDELRYQVTTENRFDLNNNRIHIVPVMIKQITASGNVVSIETVGDHNLKPLDQITISGVQGFVTMNNDINSTFSVGGVPSARVFEVSVGVVLSSAHVLNTGTITHSKMISDYVHLFAMKCKFYSQTDLSILKSVRGTPPWVEFSKRTNFRDGDKVIISGYPDAPVNGERYLKYITDSRFGLYHDQDLRIPVAQVQGMDQAGGVVHVEHYNWAEPITSDEKIGSYNRGSVRIPKYETADAMIKILPSSVECKEITIDYFAQPKVQLDFNDNTVDLTLFYPYRFLDRWIAKAVDLYSIASRDQLLGAMNDKEIQTGN